MRVSEYDIWEDYKQIYMDFSLNNDLKVRDRVLFVNPIDIDFNPKIEDIQFDQQGYFLIDTLSKPARPLTHGLPLSYETGEKEIDLSDKKGMFNFNPRKEVHTKEMPVTILVPNPRNMYGHQLSFASIAKTIMTLSFMCRRKPKGMLLHESDDQLTQILQNLSFL